MKTFLWFGDCVMPKVFRNSSEDGGGGGSGTFEVRPDSPPVEMWNAALTCRWTPGRRTEDGGTHRFCRGGLRFGVFGRQRPDGGFVQGISSILLRLGAVRVEHQHPGPDLPQKDSESVGAAAAPHSAG